jgi:hypothetical protein
LDLRKDWPEGAKEGAFIAYFGERDVGRIDRSRTGGRSAVVGETTLAPDWLRAARMPSRHDWDRGCSAAKVSRYRDSKGKFAPGGCEVVAAGWAVVAYAWGPEIVK